MYIELETFGDYNFNNYDIFYVICEFHNNK